MSTTAPDRCPSCGISYGYHLAGCAALSDGVNEEAPTATLTFHPFPQVQPPGGKELLLITSSKVFRKGDLYGGKQWRIDGDPGWNGKEYEYALKSLSDVIFWAELPDAVTLANHLGVRVEGGTSNE